MDTSSITLQKKTWDWLEKEAECKGVSLDALLSEILSAYAKDQAEQASKVIPFNRGQHHVN